MKTRSLEMAIECKKTKMMLLLGGMTCAEADARRREILKLEAELAALKGGIMETERSETLNRDEVVAAYVCAPGVFYIVTASGSNFGWLGENKVGGRVCYRWIGCSDHWPANDMRWCVFDQMDAKEIAAMLETRPFPNPGTKEQR